MMAAEPICPDCQAIHPEGAEHGWVNRDGRWSRLRHINGGPGGRHTTVLRPELAWRRIPFRGYPTRGE